MLNGTMLKQGIFSASRTLGNHQGEVDALNVFPVPDGDTGTNMSMTMEAAARELTLLQEESGFDDAADKVASAMLRGARGNSGVILSLIFRGFAKSVKGLQHVSGHDIAQALQSGSEAAYKAVMKPTEGTILTVVREAAQKAGEAAQHAADDAIAVWNAALVGAKEALAKTPSLLPVLRQAGVVDAGGQGLVYIMEGLLQGFTGTEKDSEIPILEVPTAKHTTPVLPKETELETSDIHFAYCTEVLVERSADAPQQDATALREELGRFGDCVVVVDDEEVIKVHVHSNEPGRVITLAQDYGQLIQVKVDNMRRQHEEKMVEGANEPLEVPAEKRFGIVAVATGDGFTTLYREIGADFVVTGGQSMNPSTEEILQAVKQTPAEHVFILPNNKNIIMAAEQVEPLTTKGVSVLHTKSVIEGIAAALEFSESATVEVNHVQMQRAAEKVGTGLITYAARESQVNGLDIKKGSVIGLENGKLTVTDSDPIVAATRVTRHLVRKQSGTMVTVYSGQEVSEAQTEQLVEALEKHFKGAVEVTAVTGGQPMYYFMIAVE